MAVKIKRYGISGMSCAACAARVEKAVLEVPSVSSCNVSLLTNELTINDDAKIDEVAKAVKDAGYVFLGQETKEDFGKEKELLIRLLFSCALLVVLFTFMHFKLKWPQAVLALAVMIVNRQFFISGAKSIAHLSPNMDTLVALGSFAAFIYGYYDSAAMILTFITIGKMLEAKSKGRTTDAIKSLKKMVPKTSIKLGDVFEVKAGDSIAADGEIIEGSAAVDESMLTGESIPADKRKGDKVSAGTISRTGYLKCRATAVGEDTALSKIIGLVSDAASTKAPIAKTADKVAAVFVPVVISIALVTVIAWLGIGKDLGFSLQRGISVLVISCPCALGLATPVAIMVASGKGARNGVLFKTAASIEECGRIDTVVLDKTGTITKGVPAVTDIIPAEGVSREELLRVASMIEKKSEHPLGKAIVDYVGGEIEDADEFETLPGVGVMAVIDGKNAYGGKGNYEELSVKGKTTLEFMLGDKKLGIIAVADEIKEDSFDAVNAMKKLDLKVVMLTGDNEVTAKTIGDRIGVDEVIAGVLPQEKEEKIRQLQNSCKVAMVGDGINDAPALTRADIGMAIGSGTDVAIDSADVILMKSELMDAYAAIKLGKKALQIIRENLFWAFFYNIIGIPIAAGLFCSKGISLTPALAAACMSLSSICVVSNALRLNTVNIYDKKTKEKTKMITKQFNVEGMMCPHCEAHVKEALEKIPGVDSASASHEKNEVIVNCKENVGDDVLKSAIEAAGYKVL